MPLSQRGGQSAGAGTASQATSKIPGLAAARSQKGGIKEGSAGGAAKSATSRLYHKSNIEKSKEERVRKQ